MPLTKATDKKNIRLLLVEDSRIRLGLSAFLGNDPEIEVTAEAETGEEALKIAEATMFDVAVVDLGLPGISGIEAMAILRELQPNLKLVVLTSHQQRDEVLASMAAGANAYCLKDITESNLTYVVKLVYEGGAWLDPLIARYALEVFDSIAAPITTNEESEMVQSLTPRENEVLKYIAQGKNNRQIAELLYISPHTVKANVSNILTKLSVQDRVQAAVMAIKNNLI